MQNATFHNFSIEAFTGYWNGKPKTFQPGEKVYMPAYLAEHFAKHLANRELIRAGKDTYTSPKFPRQVPVFMEVFNKAYIPDTAPAANNEIDAEIARAKAEPSMNVEIKKPANIDEGPAAAQSAIAGETPERELDTENPTGPGKAPQVITPPAGDDDDESGFDLTGDKNAKA